MADTVTPAPKRRNWLKIIGITFGVLLVLLIAGYFIGTSSGFIRSVILPKVSKSIGAEVTASDVALSPFKQIVIKDLKVQSRGHAPLFTSPEVIVKYRLFDIMKGNYNIDLVSISAPVISLVTRPDAKSNLDPVMEAIGPSEDEPMNLDLKKLVITDGTIRQEQQPSPAGSSLMEITKLNVNIDNLKTDSVGKLDMQGLLSMRTEAPVPGTNGTLAATIKANLDLGLTPMLAPNVLKGTTRIDISQATGGFALASGKAVTFDADVTPTEVRQLALRLVQGQTTLAEFAANGPFSIEKVEGTLQARLSNVDRNTLNLFAAGSGMDFAKTSISSTNQIKVANGGKSFTVVGGLLVNNLQVIQTNQSTPTLNFQAAYDASVDQAASNAVVRTLTLNGSQQGKQFLKGALTAPMVMNWGNTAQAVGDSTFLLTIDQFNLADWKVFLGDSLNSGTVNSKVEIASTKSGKQVAFNHNTRIEDLSINADGNPVSQIQLAISGDGQAANMEQFTTKFALDLTQAGARAFQLNGDANYNSATEDARATIKGTASVPQLVRIAAVEDAAFSSGAAQFDVALQQKGKKQQVQGNFNLQKLTGTLGSNAFNNFAATSKFDVAMDDQKANIRTTTIELSQDGKPGGTVNLSGTYGLTNSAAQIKLVLKDLNQNILRTFLQPSLGEKQLDTIAINGQSDINYQPGKPSAITADFKLSNFVVTDPKTTAKPKPLEGSLSIDTSINNDVAEIRKALLTLTPTERAKNQLQVTGRIDMSNTDFTSGNIKIASDSLDLTTYYNLFEGQPETAQSSAPGQPQPAPAPAPGQPQPGPEQEAEPIILPLTNFVVEAAINRFYLVELDIANLVANTRIDGGRIAINPFRMTINGAPLSSTVALDTSVSGYRYDIFFGMTNVPFAPLVNTFSKENKGQLGGAISASTQIKGAGTTGASLQKNLAGYFDVATTNLNYDISKIDNPMLRTIINVVGIVPNLMKNPTASGLGSLAGALLGGSSRGGDSSSPNSVPQGSWADELMKSPIDIIAANADMGAGQVKLERAFVQSRAFQAQAHGTVKLAQVLTNSAIDIPLNIAVARNLAESINLVPPGTPTNAAYVKLPDYVTMKGTFGEPKTDINAKALIGTALQQFGGQIPGVDKKTGNILQGLGGILTGNRPAATNAPATTNAPAQTNQGGGILGGLGAILGGGTTQTNTTATNAPAQTNNPVGNLIQGIFGPRKK